MSENATRQNGQLARNDSLWVEQWGAGLHYSFVTYFFYALSLCICFPNILNVVANLIFNGSMLAFFLISLHFIQ